ncbi:MAG: ATP-binding cassette domain-containing protein, partial [Rhizobiales bacterium]|nr:ATP-binding cassette domain-containing protein [Hyphomicrobiales bacterium]
MLEVSQLRVLDFGPYDFVLNPGDCLVIAGPSGSGKSVLLRALADLNISSGSVKLDGIA